MQFSISWMLLKERWTRLKHILTAKIYSTQFTRSLETVSLEWVMCHYARRDIIDDMAVVLLLSQVSVLQLAQLASLLIFLCVVVLANAQIHLNIYIPRCIL
jgi:hypothetical protein